MDFTDEQKQQIASWAAEGENLSNIQKRIKSEFDITMTYMDVRFLMLDLDVAIKDKDTPKPAEPTPAPPEPMPEPMSEAIPPPPGPAPEPEPALPEDADTPIGNVSIELDKVVAPGAVVSGSAVFSDGISARWSIDQLGRLGLSGVDEGYQPSEADIRAFQLEIQKALQSRGF